MRWAEREDNPEQIVFSLDGIFYKSNGMESYWVNSQRYHGTRLLYATRNIQLIKDFQEKMKSKNGEVSSETHRIWETPAFFGFQAASNAFKKHAHLISEIKGVASRTEADEIEGELLMQAMEAGVDLDTAKLVASALKDHPDINKRS